MPWYKNTIFVITADHVSLNQRKEFKNDLIADGGGCFIEYHQGNVVTSIKFTNFNNPEKGQENWVKFMDYIYSRVSFLDASK